MSLNLWLIPLLPAAGGAINGLFGRRFPKPLVTAVALASTAASFAWALYAVVRLLGMSAAQLPHIERYGTWLRSGDFTVEYGLYLDHLSMVMMLVVTGVGFLIHIYSVGYMAHEGGYYRFFSYLNLFMFFMLTLVLADNYLLMFVGWEGVGLASYLLIGFFFQRDSAANAGKKAFITNRVGDFGFLIALFLLVKHFGTLQYTEVFEKVAQLSPSIEAGAGLLTAIALLMLVGATGKSAQLPLYVWLPDAMEGPTPVSALIHAATMVTAGVYMVARSNAIFSRSPMALAVVAVIGCLTAFFAATIGIAQTDIKRVLAYSTISQLGYMFLACGVAAYSAGIFHLMTHAFFKALLFLGAGSVIHAIGGEQDMRRMGGLRKYTPYTFWTMLIATCAIAGIPGFSGFFSKDEILWQSFSSPYGHWALWLAGVITAFMTSFYMFRLLFMTFFNEYRGPLGEQQTPHQAQPQGVPGSTGHAGQTHAVPMGGEDTKAHTPAVTAHGEHGHGTPHESPWVMVVPLLILAVLAVIGGYVGVPEALHGGNHIEHFLSSSTPVPAESFSAAHEAPGLTPAGESSLELALTGVSVLVAFAGLGLAWLFYIRRRDLPDKIAAGLNGLYTAVLNKYYVDEIYGAAIIKPLIDLSTRVLWRGVDATLIDGSVDSGARGMREVGDSLRRQQSGNIRSYAGWVAAGAALVVLYMVWMGTR
ncbi:MAG: NADH-quinone oxidoreductase subunit L [Candidatus Korobacteraceae bacterium]